MPVAEGSVRMLSLRKEPAVATAVETEIKPAKSKKLLVIALLGVLLLVVAGAAVAYVLAQRNAFSDDEDEATASAQPAQPIAVPTFLPIDTMVVNLADPGGERFAQVGITVELTDAKAAERLKQFMPSIRSEILLLLSQKTSDELLQREGKEQLAAEILRQVSRPLGFAVDAGAPASAGASRKNGAKGEAPGNPVRRILFSGFIIQ